LDKPVTEESLLKGLRVSTDSKLFHNLMALLNSRLAKHNIELRTADEKEFKIVQGKAQEIDHLIKGLTRRALGKQYTGAFN
jgi:hypothetical protein